jgi:hypothetical protein
MSSITTAQAYEAVVSRNGLPTGPVRLPLIDRQSFIDAFNGRYRSAGLSIDRIVVKDPSVSIEETSETNQLPRDAAESGQ